jgi:hypothetical protein
MAADVDHGLTEHDDELLDAVRIWLGALPNLPKKRKKIK